jgi:endonuclease/exonuclease/phosphatase (EEP) superfamily protein YafD
LSPQSAKNITSNLIGGFIIGVSLLAVYSPDVPFIRSFNDYNVQMVFGLLFLGLLFLVIDQFKLLAISFSCCAMLCVFLKSASYDTLVFPKPNTSQQLSISQVNMASVNDEYDTLVKQLLLQKPDIISFQEITPLWNEILLEDFANLYPFHQNLVRIDPYGLAIFSKIPLERVDTFHTQHIPHLKCAFRLNGEKIHLISSYITPALNKQTTELANLQLRDINIEIAKCPTPIIAVGDYNRVHWSPEMMAFKQKSQLNNSRRETSAYPRDIPYEHIFFSKEIECVSFNNIEAKNYLGITGTYQYKQAETFHDFTIKVSALGPF